MTTVIIDVGTILGAVYDVKSVRGVSQSADGRARVVLQGFRLSARLGGGTLAPMSLPTEPIGSVPRPQALIDGMQAFQAGFMSKPELDKLRDAAVRDTIEHLEGTGSPVISDGEQTKPSFATSPIQGLEHLAP